MDAKPSSRVLVVDDNDQNLYLLQVLLNGNGYTAETAHNGKQALELARKNPPDLIISDILMPVMDGFALCREWHRDAVLKEIPFIFYTATYTDPKDERLAVSLGAVRFVVKPQEPEVFTDIVASVMAQSQVGELPVATLGPEQEPIIMREYSEALVRKLEDKMLQLEDTHVLLEEKIEELQITSQALKDSDERFRDFASIAADWFFEIDSNLKISYVSQKYWQITGFNSRDLIGQHVVELFDTENDSLMVDHLLKNLEANLAVHDLETIQRLDDNSELIFRYNGMPYYDSDQLFRGYRFVAHDITESHTLSLRLTHQATHDALTGLVNRWEFDRRLHRLLENSAEDSEHVLCYLDIDHFKIVNDTSGHIAGDELLRQLSDIFKKCVRERDTLARIGGDEFVILMEHCQLEHAQRVAEGVRRAVEALHFHFDKKSFNVTTSIGLVDIAPFGDHLSDVLSAADGACYAAKEQGGNRIHIYRADDDCIVRWQSDMVWTNDINNALNDGRFELFAQEIVPVSDRPDIPQRFEILIRMIDEDGNIILPENFLPAAEKYNLMQKIDHWVIETTFTWIENQINNGATIPQLSINLSGSSLGDDDLLQYLLEQFESKIDPSGICFEITETLAVSSYLRATGFIAQLREIGCHFAIDDFGSGVCSYAYLKQLDFDYIKIDGFFVRTAVDDPVDQAVVRSINEIGHLMGKKTVAEYVESESIRQELVTIGVDFAQGNGIHTPVSLSDINLSVKR